MMSVYGIGNFMGISRKKRGDIYIEVTYMSSGFVFELIMYVFGWTLLKWSEFGVMYKNYIEPDNKKNKLS